MTHEVAMHVLLRESDLPVDSDGILLGRYWAKEPDGRPLLDAPEVQYQAAGVRRLSAAVGRTCWLPADEETARACARHLYEKTGDGARAKALRTLFAAPLPRKKRQKRAEAP